MSAEERWVLGGPLEQFRAALEEATAAAGLELDFLMRNWNGRFATFNVGLPIDAVVDGRRGVRGEARHYKLLGRVKAARQGERLTVTLSPPTACDLLPTEGEAARWDAFVARLAAACEPEAAG